MPTLKGLNCQILWADTDTAFQEYGTAYGDGVVETYLAIPDKPQPFTIRLTSKGYVYEGLAVVVFIDGNYQCNRNRVNLLPPAKGIPKERTEVDFLLRQKEKPLGNETYLGREWRFDDHNVVSELPKGVKDNHFELLGTIDVLVLRCRASNPVEKEISSPASAAESDILNPQRFSYDGNNSPKINGSKHLKDTGQSKSNATSSPVLEAIPRFPGSFDGPADYPRHPVHQAYGHPPDTEYWHRHRGQGHYYDAGRSPPAGYARNFNSNEHRYSDLPHREPPSFAREYERRRPERHVRFDVASRDDSSVESLRYGARLDEAPQYYDPPPGFSHSRIDDRSNSRHDEGRYRGPTEDRPHHSRHYMYDADEGRYTDYPPPQSHYHGNLNGVPSDPTVMPSLHMPYQLAGPGLRPPMYQHQFHHGFGVPPPLSAYLQYPPPVPQTPFQPQGQPPFSHVGPPLPPPYFAQGPGYLANPPSRQFSHTPTVQQATAEPQTNQPNHGGQTPGSLDPAREENNQSDTNQANDGWNNPQTSNGNQNGGVDGWDNSNVAQNDTPGDDNWGSSNENNNQRAGWSNNDQSSNWNNNEATNQQSNSNDQGWGNESIKQQENNNDQSWGTGNNNNNNGGQNQDTNANSTWGNQPMNNPRSPLFPICPLYGPHGAYYTFKTSDMDGVVADAEEEPCYDVPQSIIDSTGSSKQVQPGKGYLYNKKRCCPEYIDTLEEPYARFVFKYRTKDQLQKELGIQLEVEPTGDEEVQALEKMDKAELINMFLRAKGALGGNIPEAASKTASSASQTSLQPVPVDPPARDFLKYKLPPRRNNSGNNPSGINNSESGSGGNGNTGWGNDTDQTTQNNNNQTTDWTTSGNNGNNNSSWGNADTGGNPTTNVNWNSDNDNNGTRKVSWNDGAQEDDNTINNHKAKGQSDVNRSAGGSPIPSSYFSTPESQRQQPFVNEPPNLFNLHPQPENEAFHHTNPFRQQHPRYHPLHNANIPYPTGNGTEHNHSPFFSPYTGPPLPPQNMPLQPGYPYPHDPWAGHHYDFKSPGMTHTTQLHPSNPYAAHSAEYNRPVPNGFGLLDGKTATAGYPEKPPTPPPQPVADGEYD